MYPDVSGLACICQISASVYDRNITFSHFNPGVIPLTLFRRLQLLPPQIKQTPACQKLSSKRVQTLVRAEAQLVICPHKHMIEPKPRT